jgi:hypothetical protein
LQQGPRHQVIAVIKLAPSPAVRPADLLVAKSLEISGFPTDSLSELDRAKQELNNLEKERDDAVHAGK